MKFLINLIYNDISIYLEYIRYNVIENDLKSRIMQVLAATRVILA